VSNISGLPHTFTMSARPTSILCVCYYSNFRFVTQWYTLTSLKRLPSELSATLTDKDATLHSCCNTCSEFYCENLYVFNFKLLNYFYIKISSILIQREGKGKAIPLQAWTDPKGSRKLRLPEFLDRWNMKVVTSKF
jgi:hypothetical protein